MVSPIADVVINSSAVRRVIPFFSVNADMKSPISRLSIRVLAAFNPAVIGVRYYFRNY